MPEQNEQNVINASPTKDFFINMLIKDITLRDAIGDLIDNSIDGANRSNKHDDLREYFVNITANKNKFEIEDNCGGIDIKTARQYAFRFGRPSEFKIEKHSIGHFGIGMKRAFFKIGNNISVWSVANKSEFLVNINVGAWQKKVPWDFAFASFKENAPIVTKSKRGTIITITDLGEDAKNSFGINNFIKDLIDEIGYEHLFSLNRGLKIKINNITVKPPNLKLIFNKDFKPAYWSHKFDNKLTAEVLVGISEDKGDEGGWYIFCNDRLITGPDTSAVTGWTGRREGADGVATYHDQFYRFRGYVFFNSQNASNLPWNTTKTGIDKDSQKYQFVRKKMIEMMRPTMTLMNRLKKEREKNKPVKERELLNKVMRAKIHSVAEVLKKKNSLTDTFVFPLVQQKKVKLGEGRIIYYKPYAKIDKVKKLLKVTTLVEVGERTFDYFYKSEIGN